MYVCTPSGKEASSSLGDRSFVSPSEILRQLFVTMLLRGRVVVAYVLASCCCIFISITNGQQVKNGHSKDADSDGDLDAWELARQNRITQQILQNYLEKRLFPHLSRMTRVPSVWEILPTGARRPLPPVVHQNNNIQEVIRSLEKNATKEQLQSVETEQVSAFYGDEEYDDWGGSYDFTKTLARHSH